MLVFVLITGNLQIKEAWSLNVYDKIRVSLVVVLQKIYYCLRSQRLYRVYLLRIITCLALMFCIIA
jgi:hypothetical protein